MGNLIIDMMAFSSSFYCFRIPHIGRYFSPALLVLEKKKNCLRKYWLFHQGLTVSITIVIPTQSFNSFKAFRVLRRGA